MAHDRFFPPRADLEAASARGLTVLPSRDDDGSTADMPSVSELAPRVAAPLVAADRRLERLGPLRVAEIRDRLASGVYASRPVLERVARRLLESGDLC